MANRPAPHGCPCPPQDGTGRCPRASISVQDLPAPCRVNLTLKARPGTLSGPSSGLVAPVQQRIRGGGCGRVAGVPGF
jgi:hypothetical protein